MSRPSTKPDLIATANENFNKMFLLINSMEKEVQTANFIFDVESAGKEAHWKRDKNIKDVLIHLHEWHILLLNWIKSNLNGEMKPFLPKPYNWKTYGQMNIYFFEKHHDTPYDVSKDRLKQSYFDVMNLIDTFSNDELFAKKQFSWTGTTTLGSYCVSATASHYDWAINKIKKHIKTYKN